jgi:ParB-like chromosome segregation protein Spo0J
MCRSFEKHSQVTPMIAGKEGSRYILIDGFKRQRAAEMLNLPFVNVMTVPVQGTMLKAQMYMLNRNSGFSMIEECMLIRELVDKDGLNQVETAVMLNRHKCWVSRRLTLIQSLNTQIIEDIKLGLLPAGSAQYLARLPQCNQGDIGSVIQKHRLNVKQSNRLIDLLCKAKDSEVKDFIIKSPIEALAELANHEGKGKCIDPKIASEAHGWIKTVSTLEVTAVKLRTQSAKTAMPLEKDVYKILNDALNRAEKACHEAFTAARQQLLLKEK